HLGELMAAFRRLYEQQYAVALFNNIRFVIEGGGGPQPQLLQRKVPLENKSIFSGSLFHYLEENKRWRSRFLFVPDSYSISYYDSKAVHDKGQHPKGTINCAGYKVLTSLEDYLDLLADSLPGVKAKTGSSAFLKCATQFPLILWHPYARHHYFCAVSEKDQKKWHAVLQDCIRHTNDGLPEEDKVQTPAFTDAVRLYRQAQGHYGTWEMMCGAPSQILSNLVMEKLLSELRDLICPRLKGKLHERQKSWMLISDAVYSLVQGRCLAQYEELLQRCEAARSSLEASIRTDMDQIISSKEHLSSKIRAAVVPKAEKLLKVSIQPYISSILDALMEPTSRGFSEVRELFFKELVDMSKNIINEGTKEMVAQHMDKISMLAFHPVKMQSCYEKVEQLSLEGLQQRFDVSSPSVFVQRAQILMREQMDNAVYTFEQILHQSLETQGTEELCKTVQRCQDRVLKKFDYDSSSVRKRFFREALLQIFIPYMLKQLSPSCLSELLRFQEMIFEDFSPFILVENIFEEVVLHSVTKDIMMAVKEAAVQRRHNLYRDSIVLSNSDPSLHLLGDNPSIDWAGEYGGGQEKTDGPEKEEEEEEEEEGGEGQKKRRMKQVVSMIQVEDSDLPSPETGAEVPSIRDIPEEDGQQEEEEQEVEQEEEQEVEQEVGQEEVEQEVEQEEGQQEQEVGQEEQEEQEVHSDAANPPDLSSASVSEEKRIQPEEQRKDSEPLEGETAAGVLEDKDTPSDLEGEQRFPPPPPTGAAERSSAPLPPPPHDGGEAGEEGTPTSSAAPQPPQPPQPGGDQTAAGAQ
uniref:Niban apoptosis regulator 2b n=1 Tax=Takifugu rubripes TaxID=31033 RepID=H2S1N4_TAKRU